MKEISIQAILSFRIEENSKGEENSDIAGFTLTRAGTGTRVQKEGHDTIICKKAQDDRSE
jgi:hypothetical protein